MSFAGQMSFAKQAFCLPFCIIMINYKFQEKEESVVSAELKRAVGDSQTGVCTFLGQECSFREQQAVNVQLQASGSWIIYVQRPQSHQYLWTGGIIPGMQLHLPALRLLHILSLQVSGSYFLWLVGLHFETELLQWNREDASCVILSKHVNHPHREVPMAADVVWETGAATYDSFPDSALLWWVRHACADWFSLNCFKAKGSHTLFQQELPFCLQAKPVVEQKCPQRCIFSQR